MQNLQRKPEAKKSTLLTTHIKNTTTLASLSNRLARTLIKTYYSFTLVQNPLERLLLRYQERSNKSSTNVFGERKNDETYYLRQNFSQFIQNYIEIPFDKWDRYFAPSSYLCQPCQVKYDFYANLKTLEYDIRAILRLLNIPQEYYVTHKLSSTSYQVTNSTLAEYYSQLSPELKLKLFNKFAFELKYYYNLYPEEKDMHLLL